MYIKESLVYDKHNGSLIDFTNLGETNNHLLEFERHVNSNTACSNSLEPLAKTMLVFMVCGMFSKLQFPYVQFPCCTITGDLLFDPFWEAVRQIEMCGLKVLATTNRRFVRIHDSIYQVTMIYHTGLSIHMQQI